MAVKIAMITSTAWCHVLICNKALELLYILAFASLSPHSEEDKWCLGIILEFFWPHVPLEKFLGISNDPWVTFFFFLKN